MLRSLLLLVVPLTLLISACGDDDDSASPTPAASGQVSETVTDGNDDTGSPGDDDDDDKTDAPGETPGEETPAPTAPGEVPTPPPTATEGTRALAPADESAFLASFEGLDVQIETCTYDLATALVRCGDFGSFAIDPTIVGQDVQCAVWLVDSAARAIQCSSESPSRIYNYEVQS